MTIWIENLKKSIENHLVSLWQDVETKNLNAINYHKVFKHYQALFPSMFEEWNRCTISGYYIPPSEAIECFASWNSYTNDEKIYVAKFCKGIYICYDEINRIWILKDNLVAVSLKEGEETNLMCTCVTYARNKVANEEWILDKKDKRYKNYMFDYDAFSHSYKGSPRFWKNPKTEECYGIELELKFASYDHKIHFANAIKANHKPWICEKDGSLDNGSPNGPSLELIGPPLPLDKLNEDIENICQLLKEHNVRSLSKNYALHITTNINNASDPVLAGARYMALINHPHYRDFWIKVAGRQDSFNPNTGKNYAAWMNIPNNIIDFMSNDLWVPRWSSKPVDHYYATFLRKGANGIETRIFKSQSKPAILKNILLLNKLAWDFAKSDVPIECWITFISSQDRILTKFLQSKKCI